MFEGNNAYRCGLSGGLQFKDSDRVYGADRPGSLSGLLSRMSMYMGFWTPLKGTIYAALRIKAQLVAKPDQRLGTDYLGNAININQANQTLLRIRERNFHDVLDSRGLRWDRERKNELFVPGKKGVIELIAAMRQVKGEEMYIFSEDGFLVSAYKRDCFYTIYFCGLILRNSFTISLGMNFARPMEGVVDAGVLPSQHGGVLLEIGSRRT